MASDTLPPAGSAPKRGADLPDLLPARMLNEFVYCPRLFHLEWVQSEFRDSGDTVEGRWQHRNVDAPGGDLPPLPESQRSVRGGMSADDRASPDGDRGDDGLASAEPPERVHARSVTLSSDRLGLIAVIDVVEAEGLRATPVDYKRGTVPERGPWEPERVQLCAQALLLREHGYTCDSGVLYFAGSRQRVPVPIDEALVGRTLSLVADARVAAAGPVPPPLDGSPKCPRCSLAGICLPDETRAFAAAAPAAPAEAAPVVRRLFAARPVSSPVVVQEPGATVGRSGERLVIRTPAGAKTEVRLIDVSQLCVFGNVQVSAQAVRDLAARDVPIVHFSGGGWFEAITTGPTHRNVGLRIAQFAAAADTARSLAIARRIVEAKIRNQRTILRRNHPQVPPDVLHEMNRLAGDARRAGDADRLLGLEGAAARAYFGRFCGMLSPTVAWPSFDFASRNRRPPRDPVNALLSFVYAMLVKDLVVTLTAVGFDPYLGFFHRPRYGRPALALDLAEEFRPLVGDSVVLAIVNTGEVRPGDFVQRAGAAALTPAGRRRVVGAYERRMDVLVRHPALGYSVSYRRLLELQARILSRHLSGELPDYVPFRTR